MSKPWPEKAIVVPTPRRNAQRHPEDADLRLGSGAENTGSRDSSGTADTEEDITIAGDASTR